MDCPREALYGLIIGMGTPRLLWLLLPLGRLGLGSITKVAEEASKQHPSLHGLCFSYRLQVPDLASSMMDCNLQAK